jgi:hypothetical protein
MRSRFQEDKLMGRFKPLLGATAAALALTAGVATAQVMVPDRSTIVTISAPVSVPGVVLPAGEYLFRLADSKTNRNIVQIYDKDRTKIFATLLAIPAERNEPSGEAVVTFRETPADQAPALKYWYFAGEKAGNEFAYPKQQAIEIARASNESVMAMDTAASDVESMEKAELHRVEPDSAEVTSQAARPAAPAAAAEQPAAPATPAEQPAAAIDHQSSAPAPAPPQRQAAAPSASAATPAEPPAPAQAAAPAQGASEPRPAGTSGRDVMPAPAGTSGRSDAAADTERELPRTAGELPTIALLGFLALGAAAGARALRRCVVI